MTIQRSLFLLISLFAVSHYAVTEEKAVGSGWTSISSGKYCTTRYKSYKDTNCKQACIDDGAGCGSYTEYSNGWCQLIAPGCSSWNTARDTTAITWTRCPSADLRDRSGVQKRGVRGEDQIGTCSECARGYTDISDGIVFNWVDGTKRNLVLTDKYGNWILDGQLPVSDSNYRNTDDWDRSDWKGSTHGYDVEKFNGCADRTCEHATTVQGGEMWTSCSSNPSCPSGYWPDGPSYDAAPSMWEAKNGKFGMNCVLGRKQKCQNSECHRWGPSSTSSGLNTLAESSIDVYSFMRQGSFYVLAPIGLFATIAFLWKAFNKTATYTEVLEEDDV